MAVESISGPVSSPLLSHLPPEALSLARNLYPDPLHFITAEDVKNFRRAADYISAAMIFLKDNILLERDLVPDDIKNTLHGHWGTCPGLNLIYAHLNLVIEKYDQEMILLTGPGHGAPAILSCLWLEQSLERFYPQYTRDENGLRHLICDFGVPGGLSSYINAQMPGSIHPGGELGHVLSVAYGSVLDKPDLISVAIIGDGEAETGPTAAAWHSCKYIDPKESGAVLPILHVNGFKISERTIYSCMDDQEIACLFAGYGYEPCFVEDLENIDNELQTALCWAIDAVHRIQLASRTGHPYRKPRWPMIVLRTPKGWGGPKTSHGRKIEGSFRAHQVPLPRAKHDPSELLALQEWLHSYNPRELFPDGQLSESVKRILPVEDKRKLGQNQTLRAARQPLSVPEWKHFAIARGTVNSFIGAGASFFDETLRRNPHSLRLFSADDLGHSTSATAFDYALRTFQWDEDVMNQGGHLIEVMSEHTCEGLMQGYTATGRTGIFIACESALPKVSTMVIQYSRFLDAAKATSWRRDFNSLNYLATDTWTSREHTGPSQHYPGFIGTILKVKPDISRVYLPPDANTFLSTLAHCLRSKNFVNYIIGSKESAPVWLSPEAADTHCKAGASIWQFASTDDGINPDVVLVGIGADLMFEVLAAVVYLRRLVPSLAIRVINVTDLWILSQDGSHPHALKHQDFDTLFTPQRHIHFNYHGYANELQGLLFGRPNLDRVSIGSYEGAGSNTTPLGVLLQNRCSRYHVAEAAVRGGAQCNPRVALNLQELVTHIQHDRAKATQYIEKYGIDPPRTYDVPQFPQNSDLRQTNGTKS